MKPKKCPLCDAPLEDGGKEIWCTQCIFSMRKKPKKLKKHDRVMVV